MRRVAMATTLTLAVWLAGPAARAEDARPEFSIDEQRLPPLVPMVPKSERDQQSLLAAGTGAIVGIVVVDVLTGGLLLAPLGLPSFASLFAAAPAAVPAGAAVAAPAAPTFTIVQQVLAGVATTASSLGGGYLGMRVAGPVAAQ